jgi:hypothetical protein
VAAALRGAHDEDRHRRCADDVLGNAAEDEPGQAAAPVAPEDDEIDDLGCGRANDDVRRVSRDR